MEGEARVSVEPLPHFRMLVGGVVVEDHVHDFSDGHRCPLKADLPRPMPLKIAKFLHGG